jgi:hypothetical protein
MSTSAATPAAEQPTAGALRAGDGHGWRAVSIVLVGAFMAPLDRTFKVFNKVMKL